MLMTLGQSGTELFCGEDNTRAGAFKPVAGEGITGILAGFARIVQF